MLLFNSALNKDVFKGCSNRYLFFLGIPLILYSAFRFSYFKTTKFRFFKRNFFLRNFFFKKFYNLSLFYNLSGFLLNDFKIVRNFYISCSSLDIRLRITNFFSKCFSVFFNKYKNKSNFFFKFLRVKNRFLKNKNFFFLLIFLEFFFFFFVNLIFFFL